MSEKLKDVVDINQLQKLQDTVSNVLGMSIVAYNQDGYVTRVSNSNSFAAKYSKNSVLAGQENIKNAKDIPSGKPILYTADDGLVEIGVNVYSKGESLFTLVAGQVNDGSLNETKISRISADLGVDSGDFTDDLAKVTTVDKKYINYASDFLGSIVQVMSSGIIKSATTSPLAIAAEFKGDADSAKGRLFSRLTEVGKMVSDNTANNNKLNDSFDSLNSMARESVKKLNDTKEAVKSIQNVAMNTRILGFNASIEASRAKESGKGFGVIAQEIRNLADVSNTSTEQIENLIQNIGQDTENLSQSFEKTENIIRSNIDNAGNIAAILSEIVELAKEL